MDYLTLSPFWDSTCTNELLKMQLRHGVDSSTSFSIDQLQQRLEQMTSGIEYVLNYSAPRLFVVHKRRRLRPGNDRNCAIILAVIYVIDGNAYIAPRASEVVVGRLSSCIASLQEAQNYGQSMINIDNITGEWKLDRSDGTEPNILLHPKDAIEHAQLNALNASFKQKIM
jgi:mediator of RNA polymerase II transcription subunit 6